MAITAAMVKELRELTGAGMMDCKKALGETDGNMDEAVEYLRKNGQAKAEKKAGRIAAEGLCTVVVKDDKTAAVVEVNSETDFVAKNDTFREFVEAVATQAVNSDAADMDAFMEEKWNADESKTVKDALVEKVAVIGENLKIRRFEKVVAENGCVVSYIHGGGRIGVIVDADTTVVNDAVKEALTMDLSKLFTKIHNASEEATYMRMTTNGLSYTKKLKDVSEIKDKVGKGMKVVETISKGVTYAGYGMDIVDTIYNLSTINTNNEIFEANLDALTYLIDNSKDTHAKAAALSIRNIKAKTKRCSRTKRPSNNYRFN